MAEKKKKDEAAKIADDLAEQYKKEGEEVDEAVEKNRDEVEKYYAEQAEKEEANQRRLREYQLGGAAPSDDKLVQSEVTDQEPAPPKGGGRRRNQQNRTEAEQSNAGEKSPAEAASNVANAE